MKTRVTILIVIEILMGIVLTRSSVHTFPPPAAWREGVNEDELDRNNLRLVTDELTATAGDAQAYLDWVAMWAPEMTPPIRNPASAWMKITDLDDDGQPEWLVSIPELEWWDGRMTILRCEVGGCPSRVVLFERREARFVPVYTFMPVYTVGWFDHADVVTLSDLDGNGKTDLVLSSTTCGAHTCGTEVVVGRWTGQEWVNMAAVPIYQLSTDLRLQDRDGDGIKEIVLYGGLVGSVGAGLQRKHTLVFALRDGLYRQTADVPDADPDIYFLMLDANAALASGDLDRALELALQAVNSDRATYFDGDSGSRLRIQSYAAIEAMLVYALRGEPQPMEALWRTVESNWAGADSVYVVAARDLWHTYQATRDVGAACAAAKQVVRTDLEHAPFFQYYGYAMERLTLDRFCPLDRRREPGEAQVEL